MLYRIVSVAFCVLLLVCSTSFAEGEKWTELSSEHFLLITDTSEAKGRALLSDFEARAAMFSEVFGPLPPRQFPIEIFVFRNEADYLETLPRLDPIPGDERQRRDPRLRKSAFLLRGPDRIFVVAKDKSPEDIANDVAHALGHVLFERMVTWRPFWLAEGVAEYVRKIGRDADTKSFSKDEGFTAADVLTIVPSASYDDNAEPGPFRTLSYRLVRVLLEDHPAVLKRFFAKLREDTESLPKIGIDPSALESKLQAYKETPLKAVAAAATIKAAEALAARLAIHRGDLVLASDRPSEAARYYNGDSKEARAARAINTRFSRSGFEAIRVLDRASREVPGHGLLQYHFGALEANAAKDLEAQTAALERAVEILPLMGRAHAELARLYAVTGNASRSLPLLDKALQLEPEFADRMYEIRADVYTALGAYSDAFRSIQIAAVLPHVNPSQTEKYMLKISGVRKKIENERREAEDRRVQQIRRELEAEVARREPPPKPAPPAPPVPAGFITYQIEARSVIEVVEAVYPEYPEALRKAGSTGAITLRLDVGPDGKVKTASIASSTLHALNTATLDAVKKWSFKPGNRSVRLTLMYSLQ